MRYTHKAFYYDPGNPGLCLKMDFMWRLALPETIILKPLWEDVMVEVTPGAENEITERMLWMD